MKNDSEYAIPIALLFILLFVAALPNIIYSDIGGLAPEVFFIFLIGIIFAMGIFCILLSLIVMKNKERYANIGSTKRGFIYFLQVINSLWLGFILWQLIFFSLSEDMQSFLVVVSKFISPVWFFWGYYIIWKIIPSVEHKLLVNIILLLVLLILQVVNFGVLWF